MKKLILNFLSLFFVLTFVLTGCSSGVFQKSNENVIDKPDGVLEWYIEKRDKIYFNIDGEITQKNSYLYNEYGQPLKVAEFGKALEYRYGDDGQLDSLTYNDLVFDLSFSKQNGQFVAQGRSDNFSNLTSVEVISNKKNQLLSQKFFNNQKLIFYEEFSYYDNGIVKTQKYEEDDSTYIEKYDNRGNILEYDSIKNGINNEKIIFEYSDGMIIGSKIYTEKSYYVYETLEKKEKNKTRTVIKNQDGSVNYYTEYEYDDYKHLIRLSRYNEGNFLYFQSNITWKTSK